MNQQEELVLNMVNFYILFEKEFTSLIPQIEESDITPLLSRMLNEIHLLGRTTSKELGERLNISVPNTSRGVNLLYKKELIEKRQCDSDRRIVYLTLSKQGLELIQRYLLLYQEMFFHKLRALSPQEIDRMNASFSQIKELFMKINQPPKE